MRFKVDLEIISEQKEIEIPIRYHALFLSLLKRGLMNAALPQYQELYEKNQEKLFAQAVFFHGSRFEKERIVMEKPAITWFWSSPKADLAMAYYNAFIYLKGLGTIPFSKDLSIKVKNITLISQPALHSPTVTFQTVSPILVRKHDRENRKDWFLGFQDDAFIPVLKENLKRRLTPELGKGVCYDIDALKIEPLNMKKTVTKTYEKFLQGSYGRIRFIGEPYLLNFIKDVGIGSKTGLFYGYVNPVVTGGEKDE